MAKKVLIVEDAPDISEALQQLIEIHGYEALTALTGLEALRIVKEEAPDLILMDLALPDLTGIEVTRKIRSDPRSAETPILCVSSYSDGFAEEMLEAGCNEVFSKSSFIDSLGTILRKYLQP